MDTPDDERLRAALRSLEPLAAKVAQVHGEHNPKLIDLQRAFCELRELLRGRPVTIETVAMLDQIRELADDFVPPSWACRSYRELLSGLESLETVVLRSA